MKRTILLFSLCIILVATASYGMMRQVFIDGKKDTSGCTDITAGTLDGWKWAYYDNQCQKVKYAGASCTIGSATVEMYYDTSSGDAHLEVWDGEDMSTASQIGGDSSTQTINTSSAATFTFTWSANKPTPSADYFLHIIQDGANNLKFTTNTGVSTYEDTDYDAWQGNDGSVIDIDRDAIFSINYD